MKSGDGGGRRSKAPGSSSSVAGIRGSLALSFGGGRLLLGSLPRLSPLGKRVGKLISAKGEHPKKEREKKETTDERDSSAVRMLFRAAKRKVQHASYEPSELLFIERVCSAKHSGNFYSFFL